MLARRSLRFLSGVLVSFVEIGCLSSTPERVASEESAIRGWKTWTLAAEPSAVLRDILAAGGGLDASLTSGELVCFSTVRDGREEMSRCTLRKRVVDLRTDSDRAFSYTLADAQMLAFQRSILAPHGVVPVELGTLRSYKTVVGCRPGESCFLHGQLTRGQDAPGGGRRTRLPGDGDDDQVVRDFLFHYGGVRGAPTVQETKTISPYLEQPADVVWRAQLTCYKNPDRDAPLVSTATLPKDGALFPLARGPSEFGRGMMICDLRSLDGSTRLAWIPPDFAPDLDAIMAAQPIAAMSRPPPTGPSLAECGAGCDATLSLSCHAATKQCVPPVRAAEVRCFETSTNDPQVPSTLQACLFKEIAK